jgi:hypothetical protein
MKFTTKFFFDRIYRMIGIPAVEGVEFRIQERGGDSGEWGCFLGLLG